MTLLIVFLHGATAACCAAITLFFARFWRRTGDRLFLAFAIAFAVLGVNRVLVALVPASAAAEGSAPYLYLLRVVAFGLIAFAIIDKNRVT